MPRFHMNKRSHRRRRRKGIGKVKRDIKWLKKNIEFKFADIQGTAISASVAGIITPLNLTAANDNVNGRSGQEVTARRIAIRGIINNTNGTPVDTIVRIILFRELRVNGVLPTLSNVLLRSGAVIVNSWRDMTHKSNIKILFDTTFTMDTLTHSLIPFKLIYRLNHTCEYTGTTAVIAGMQANGMFLVALSEVATGANAPTVSFESRFSYVDG